jgi:hypothetical protein
MLVVQMWKDVQSGNTAPVELLIARAPGKPSVQRAAGAGDSSDDGGDDGEWEDGSVLGDSADEEDQDVMALEHGVGGLGGAVPEEEPDDPDGAWETVPARGSKGKKT